MTLVWLDKLRGPIVQDNGVQLPDTGRIGTLNFLNANLDFNEHTGVLSIDFDISASLPDMSTDRILGRDTAGTGPVENITVGGGIEFTGSGGIQRSAITGDVSISAGSSTSTININTVTNAKLRDSTGLSVIGRSANSLGDPADIVAANDGEVLRRSGTTLGFGTITTSGLGDDSVTFPKIQNISTDRLLGRDTAGTGDIEEISLNATLEFTGTGSIQRAALTGDVTASAGSNTTVITNDAITDAKLRNSAGTSVIGRALGSGGDPADIVASEDNVFLGRVDGELGFFAITLEAGEVTLDTIEDINTDRILGRDTAGIGEIEELIVTGGLEFTGAGGIQRSALTGDVTASAGSNTTTISNNAVTDLKLRDSTAYSVIGRSAGTSGDPADIVAGTDTVLGRNGSGTLVFAQVQTGQIADTAITNAKLRNSAATSVIGRSAGTTGVPADIAASADNQFLGRVSGVLQFTSVTGGALTDGTVPISKLEDIATDRILGRDTAGTGPVELLTVTGGVEFSGSGGIQRSALTGDVTASAGSNATTIANNAVTDVKLRDSAGFSVIGKATTGSGDPADIVAGTDTVLGRNGSANLAFTQVQTGMIAAQAVTFAKIQNIATDRLIGRDTALSGSPEEITVGGGIEFTGSLGIQRSALTGDVTASAGSNTTVITNDAVTDAKLRNSVGLSVIGRSANTTGDPADIVAANDGEVLRRSGTTLGFGTITGAGITNGTITTNKLQDIATDTLLGRDTAGTGPVEVITVGGGIEFTGTTSIRVGAYTGDVTKTAGGTTLTIANDAVTYAKIQNVSATSRILGRITAGAGDIEELTGAQVVSLLAAPGSTGQQITVDSHHRIKPKSHN